MITKAGCKNTDTTGRIAIIRATREVLKIKDLKVVLQNIVHFDRESPSLVCVDMQKDRILADLKVKMSTYKDK